MNRDASALYKRWANRVPRFKKGEDGKTVEIISPDNTLAISKAGTSEPGAMGPQGMPGTTGSEGPQGEPGPAGAQGIKGDPGPTGSQGPKGEKGDIGATGTAGPKGDQGQVGPQGVRGEAGLQGPTGAAGPVGTRGETGATGPRGDIGPTGAQGLTGMAGTPGDRGLQGLPGPQGIQGETGPAGPAGATGARGAAGADAKRIETYSGTTDANGLFTVTFTTPFPTVPSIQPEPPLLGSQVWTKVSATTTGFSIKLQQRNSATLLNLEILLAAMVNVVGAPAKVVVIAA